MRKLKIILLLIILPCLVHAQSATILELHVRKIPLTALAAASCEKQKVFLYFEKGMMGVLTYDDTLQLRKVRFVESDAYRSKVLCVDEIHNNIPYSVEYVRTDQGIAIFITPMVELPHRMTIILSSKPCN